jgi:hypothetical protein
MRRRWHVAAIDLRLQAEAAELTADHQQVHRLDVGDAQLAAGRRRQRHEAADLDVVGRDRVLGPGELVAPVHRHHVGTDAVDLGAHRAEQPSEVLHVGLAGSVGDRRRPGRQRRSHQGVLGAHHRGLVHEDRAGAEAVGGSAELDPAVAVDAGAEILEGVEVGVEAPAADEIPARRRHPRLAEAGEQRAGEQERGADLLREILVDRDIGDRGGAEADAVIGHPGDLHPEPLEQGKLRLGVANARHPVQEQLLLGQQTGGEDRQRRVLVAGDGHLAGERHAAFDDEFLHRFRLG